MRPDRRIGGGLAAQAWAMLAIAVMAGQARAQGWTPGAVEPRGHSGPLTGLALAGDGRTMATSGEDGLAKVWDVGKASIGFRVDLAGHRGEVRSVAVSPMGKLVATGGQDRTVRLWDSADGKALAVLTGHAGPVEAVAFSPDGRTVASGGLDATVRLWDVAEPREIRSISGHERGIVGLAFSPDGQALASASRDHSVKLWDVATGAERLTLGHHDAQARCLAFSPDGKLVASGGLDATVRLWRVGEAEPPAPPPGQPAEFFVPQAANQEVQSRQVNNWSPGGIASALAFTPDGRGLAAAVAGTGPRPGPGHVMFLPMAALIPNQPPGPSTVGAFGGKTILGHLGPIRALAITPDGSTVLTGGDDRAVRLWDFATGKALAASIGPRPPGPAEGRVMAHLDPVESLAYSPDGRKVVLATGGTEGVALWDASTREPIAHLADPSGLTRALAWSPDGKTLAVGGDGKAVVLLDAATGLERARLGGHLGPISALAFSTDGKLLASGSNDASASIWDVDRRVELATLARHTSALTALAFSPDGKLVATGSTDFGVKLWEARSGQLVATLDGHREVVSAVAFSPDGKLVASADRAGAVRLWDAVGGASKFDLPTHSGPVHALAFSPDGKALVIGGDDGSIRAVDPVDGRSVASIPEAHAGAVTTLAFGPGGRTLASGGLDRELRLWDAAARLAPRPFGALEGKVRQLAISADGQILATATEAGKVQTWDLADGRERSSLIERAAPLVRLAFSPDGKTLATLATGFGSDGLKLWDVATGRERDGPRIASVGPTEPGAVPPWPSLVAFSSDGRSVATAEETTVHLWGLATNRQVRDYEGAKGPIAAFALSPDGKLVAAGSVDGSVTTWDVATRKPRAGWKASPKAVAAVAFSPDGKLIAAGGLDRVVRLFDPADGKPVATLRGPSRPIEAIAFSPDGKLVASAADGEPTLFAWEVEGGALVSTPAWAGVPTGDGFATLAFAPDGKALIGGGARGIASFSMMGEGRPPALVAAPSPGGERATLLGHASAVRSLAFLDGGAAMISRSEDGAVKVWDVANARELRALGGGEAPVRAMAIAPDGKTLAVGLRPPKAKPAPPAEPQVAPPADPVAPGPQPPAPGGPTTTGPAPKPPDPAAPPLPAPAPPPTGLPDEAQAEPRPTLESPFEEVKLWDLTRGETLATIAGKATIAGQRPRDLVVALAYSRDGRLLATASRAGMVRLWDARTLAPGVELARRESGVDLVFFTPDGSTVVAANADPGLVTLWDVATGKVRASFAHHGGMNSIVSSPDGKTLATGGGKLPPANPNAQVGLPTILDDGPGDVRLWDVATGRRLAVLPLASGRVVRLAYSPDGKTLAASGDGPTLRLWDVADSSPRGELAWDGDRAHYLAFSPDGRTLAVGGEDEALRLWDTATLKAQTPLRGHSGAIQWVAFTPDGKLVATAGRDAAIKLWDVIDRRP